MRPLEPLSFLPDPGPRVEKLLRASPADEARAALEVLEPLVTSRLEAAALAHARGALSLRTGNLDLAERRLSEAASAFEAAGEKGAARLARAEALLAVARRGPREALLEARAALGALVLEAEAAGDAPGHVVSLHYRATAERLSGDAAATQSTLLEALERSEAMPEERAKVLNSLGTLYVTLGAAGAAIPLLEHAAELHHQRGDRVGEAIAFGQLGSAALARGDAEGARVYLQKQEWLASGLGDAFGRARALTFLAECALELGRPDDARAFAKEARDLAERASPPLELWVAYATRALARAGAELGDADARAEAARALSLFGAFGNPLGTALATWDLARLEASGPGDGRFFEAAWALGSLGLTARVAQLLAERRGPASALALAQAHPHLAMAQEIELLFGAPKFLLELSRRRAAAAKNLGRLAALSLAESGLVVGAVAGEALGRARESAREDVAIACALPGAELWVWPVGVAPEALARDLVAARLRVGEDLRALLAFEPAARVAGPGFHGEPSPQLLGVDALAALGRASSLEAGALVRSASLPWTDEAEALARQGGFRPARLEG